jgi:PilZ domain
VGSVTLQVGSAEVPVRILNLSLGGISLEINQKIEIGSLLALSLRNAARGASYLAVLRVLSAHPATEPLDSMAELADHPTRESCDTWRVGAVFTQSLTQEAFKSLV